MTERMMRALRAIDRLTVEFGYPPTMREIGREIGVSSPSTVKDVIDQLSEAGLVAYQSRCPRTLRITGKGRAELV